MEHELDPQHLSSWLAEIVKTDADEVDCEALAQVLESLAAIAESGRDITPLMPDVATHLVHCPECRDWYDTLKALSPELE